MKVKNTTRKNILAKKAKFCRNPLSKGIGLMFKKKLENKAMIFVFGKERIISLHTVFVFFPIDILYIGRDKRVKEIKESLRPFSFYTPRHKAQYIIELPQGTIQKTATSVGDKIEF